MSTDWTQISRRRTLTQADFNAFAALSGDDNPIHLNPEFSAQTAFGRTVAHGMLLYSVLRGMMEVLLPGARQIEQDLMFPAPAYAEEPLQFKAEITGRSEGRAELALSVARIADGTVVCKGRAALAPQEGRG